VAAFITISWFSVITEHTPKNNIMDVGHTYSTTCDQLPSFYAGINLYDKQGCYAAAP